MVAFHLSTNQVYGDGDDIISPTTRTITSLGVKATNWESTAVTVPVTTLPGSYYLCVGADDGNSVVESDETNNTLCDTGIVTVQ